MMLPRVTRDPVMLQVFAIANLEECVSCRARPKGQAILERASPAAVKRKFHSRIQ
jgi:hypothetical protein